MADLSVTREQVELHVLSQGKKGFLGIGKQLAEVELTVKPVEPEVKQPAQPVNPQPVAETTVTPAPQKEPVQPAVKPATHAQKSVAKPQAKARQRAAVKEQQEKSFEEVLVELGNYLAEVTKNMGISATINVTPEKHTVYYDFETDHEGLLIGKRGKTLNSLQLLAQDFLDKRVRRRVRVILDVADYRERRAETLTHLAQKTARDAIAAGKPLALDPMPALERKVIHKSLADNPHVETHSRGSEPRRTVVVTPI
ncbi:RNA-binding protein [Ligilactobacillus pabuli]|uniref:RNA-binding protein KhpB n=1 Tax=Ligilactobacillus pabuli TaxID=2886039 RepID=A0ABQ5JIE6_9LACO|nr:RNA-binding protein [Ligilactobacillus pabuli]